MVPWRQPGYRSFSGSRQRPWRCAIPSPTPTPGPTSIVFDRAAGYYDQTRGFPAEVGERIADRIDAAAGPGSRLLEIGVGTGRISLPLHRRGRRLFGVDLSAPMVGQYRAKAAAEGLAAPAVVLGDATGLPFRDRSFDALIEVHVLHLIPRWREAVAEVRRVLAPGGMLLASRRIWERSEGTGPQAEARGRHRALLRELGLRPGKVGARGDDEVIGALGGRVEELAPVSWREPQTWAESLDILERRVWSESWRIPEGPWHAALLRLRAELDAEGVDLHAPVAVQRHVDLAAIHL